MYKKEDITTEFGRVISTYKCDTCENFYSAVYYSHYDPQLFPHYHLFCDNEACLNIYILNNKCSRWAKV